MACFRLAIKLTSFELEPDVSSVWVHSTATRTAGWPSTVEFQTCEKGVKSRSEGKKLTLQERKKEAIIRMISEIMEQWK